MIEVVLVNPEIPPNTGNIGRLCCAVGARLNLIEPLGFSLDDRYLKRAGLDYWNNVDLKVWPQLEDYLSSLDHNRIVLTGSKKGTLYCELEYREDDHILFGPETTGFDSEMFRKYGKRTARLPIHLDKVRSLNLSTSAGIIVFEALRQIGGLPKIHSIDSVQPVG